MSLGMEVLKTTMMLRNGVAPCKKRPYTVGASSAGGRSALSSSSEHEKDTTAKSDRLPLTSFDNEQPIARICIDKRLIPPKVARLKSARAVRPPTNSSGEKNDLSNKWSSEAKTFRCVQCESSFSTENELLTHNASNYHLNRVKTIAEKRLKAFGHKTESVCNGGTARQPNRGSESGTDEPLNWKILVNYCQSRGKRLDLHMRGGFTGPEQNVFLFEVDVCVGGQPFSGVGTSLNEAKQDVANRALSSLSDVPPTDQWKQIDELDAICEGEEALTRLKRDLYIVLGQIADLDDNRDVEKFNVQVLNALCQIAAKDDRLVGAMPVGSLFKGLLLAKKNMVVDERSAPPTAVLVFCSCWPTYGLVTSVLEQLHRHLPNATLRGPQGEIFRGQSTTRLYSVDVHFTTSIGWYANIEQAFNCCDEELPQTGDNVSVNGRGPTEPLPRHVCLHAQNLLTAARRFKRRIAVNQSAVSVLHILTHLYHMHDLLLADDDDSTNLDKISESRLESLLDYWLLVKNDASIEWLFCRMLHSLAYDETLFPHTTGGKNLSVQLLAKYCLRLVKEQRLLDAFGNEPSVCTSSSSKHTAQSLMDNLSS